MQAILVCLACAMLLSAQHRQVNRIIACQSSLGSLRSDADFGILKVFFKMMFFIENNVDSLIF
jgi:hypothetical protein